MLFFSAAASSEWLLNVGVLPSLLCLLLLWQLRQFLCLWPYFNNAIASSAKASSAKASSAKILRMRIARAVGVVYFSQSVRSFNYAT